METTMDTTDTRGTGTMTWAEVELAYAGLVRVYSDLDLAEPEKAAINTLSRNSRVTELARAELAKRA